MELECMSNNPSVSRSCCVKKLALTPSVDRIPRLRLLWYICFVVCINQCSVLGTHSIRRPNTAADLELWENW